MPRYPINYCPPPPHVSAATDRRATAQLHNHRKINILQNLQRHSKAQSRRQHHVYPGSSSQAAGSRSPRWHPRSNSLNSHFKAAFDVLSNDLILCLKQTIQKKKKKKLQTAQRKNETTHIVSASASHPLRGVLGPLCPKPRALAGLSSAACLHSLSEHREAPWDSPGPWQEVAPAAASEEHAKGSLWSEGLTFLFFRGIMRKKPGSQSLLPLSR